MHTGTDYSTLDRWDLTENEVNPQPENRSSSIYGLLTELKLGKLHSLQAYGRAEKFKSLINAQSMLIFSS